MASWARCIERIERGRDMSRRLKARMNKNDRLTWLQVETAFSIVTQEPMSSSPLVLPWRQCSNYLLLYGMLSWVAILILTQFD